MVISETEILEEEEEPKETEAETEPGSQTDVPAAEVQYGTAPIPPLPAPAAGGSFGANWLGDGAAGEKLEAVGSKPLASSPSPTPASPGA